jgi:hypothetical protein
VGIVSVTEAAILLYAIQPNFASGHTLRVDWSLSHQNVTYVHAAVADVGGDGDLVCALAAHSARSVDTCVAPPRDGSPPPLCDPVYAPQDLVISFNNSSDWTVAWVDFPDKVYHVVAVRPKAAFCKCGDGNTLCSPLWMRIGTGFSSLLFCMDGSQAFQCGFPVLMTCKTFCASRGIKQILLFQFLVSPGRRCSFRPALRMWPPALSRRQLGL